MPGMAFSFSLELAGTHWLRRFLRLTEFCTSSNTEMAFEEWPAPTIVLRLPGGTRATDLEDASDNILLPDARTGASVPWTYRLFESVFELRDTWGHDGD